MELFNFAPSMTTAEIRLAFSYVPRILNNHIARRKSTSLLYVLSGRYDYFYESSSFSACANSLVYLPANAVPYDYRVTALDGEVVKVMQIEFDLLDVSSKEHLVYSAHPLLLTKCADHAISHCFEKIIAKHTKTDAESKLTVYSELLKLMGLCVSCTKDVNCVATHQKIAFAIEFIQCNYKSSIAVSELAAICHIGESQLRRIFMNEIGMSPMKYKNKLLLEEACRLLNNGALSIGEISEILGFCDIYAFSHFFLKHKGLSPTAYKAMQSAENKKT